MSSTDRGSRDSDICQRATINNRRWIGVTSTRRCHGDDDDDDDVMKFRLLTYNILSDRAVHDGDYLYCPAQLRYMSSRHDRIIAEIRAMQPHVVCLQEVDYEHYTTRLRSAMNQLGYDGILLQRQDDYGLATFWDTSVFELVAQKHATLHHLAETHLQMSELNVSERQDVRKAIDRPEAVLLVRLTTTNNNNSVTCARRDLAVANVHVTWSQLNYPALQALQASLAVNELLEFVRLTSPPPPSSSNCAVIICGDFNSPPHTLPYQLLSRAQLDDVILDKLRRTCHFTQQVERLRVYGLADVLQRAAFTINTPIKSAYKTQLGVEPTVTNSDDCGGLDGVRVHQLCLDYIWYSGQSLDVSAVLETPSAEDISRHCALPSQHFPSDHIPLLAEFRFTTASSDKHHAGS